MIIDDIRSGQNGNQQAILNLISKFSPALKKYARKLGTEDGYYDLQAEFLELIIRLDCSKLRETGDGALVQYLSHSIYHAYIKLLRHLIDSKLPTSSIDELTDSRLYQNLLVYEAQYDILELPPKLLTEQETSVFFQICILGYSAADLARKMNTSRQNVNQTKQRAISKLKRYLQETGQV